MTGSDAKTRDVVIVGGGPAGAATALYLLRGGIKPVILEKGQFPRYHIGESMTGECGGVMRDLGFEAQMNTASYPVKHGVKVYGESGANTFWIPVCERGPSDDLKPNSTWQVVRSSFDDMLLNAAVERGAELLPCEAVSPLTAKAGRVSGVRYRTSRGQLEDVRSQVVVDASGQATFLANRGVTTPAERGSYDKQLAVFSQVAGAIRDPGDGGGNTLIFYREKNRWAWFIPLDDEIVSVGAVVPSEYYVKCGLSTGDFLRHEMRTLNAELARRVANVTFVEEVRTASNYSYQVRGFTGPGYLCVGDSHRFIDPIFSFGLYVGVKEGQFAAQAIQRLLEGEAPSGSNPFADYQTLTDGAQDVLQDLIDCFWDFPLAFMFLVHHRAKDEMIDLFAGRIYGEKVTQGGGVRELRELLAQRPG